jgi:hypothetical protein
MRAIRHIAVALIVCALALVPAAGFAQMRATQHEMSASAHDMSAGPEEDACPCCDPSPRSAADACILKCYSALAILTGAPPMPEWWTVAAPDTAAGALSPFGRPPDPPPPRS